ncbi:chromate efflux transporter [Bradyrhizobium sp. U87765 SZCCT0131]|uniref:chromate efflux transporter n=1 Tax=unclassified Bradyrhizobium TaxID=2631580 RepID=UPI001BAD382E|nr:MULTISPECIES: chromate efflux transporter [unclassified Bradyrhizobium]MBR1220127.1 chromate efflux transporter [Bradyrhizobium sp. U87765 SZCCT0131]MBR1263417.1 chromate efflux transporter [Bradyrhizobium sp. U87765 SZCCT0134]MBR1306700.1 chromate efflux transporter [Bradyrhizobium sp. U87765 SZCCT0110]MBR1323199.1 chromate efflux transporter [Bradyrhizobium sp. U87765 SZCCT0109]MBR1345654.1 chromate efflux transporter [Bradyrhizobium sp. U87765 SZCCT0048]
MTEAMTTSALPAPSETPAFPSFGDAFRVWARIALLSFGGPAGQIAVMHRILVDEKRWVSESRFLHALNYCMLLPGPEAQQLATYIGWLMHRTAGGIMAGGLFVLPGAISIMALSYVYALFGKVGIVAALFFGLKAAVLAIVVQAVVRVGRRALKTRVMRGLAAAAFVAIFFFDAPFPLIILAAGVIGGVGGRARLAAFAPTAPHDSKTDTALVDSLLGDRLPDHARPTIARTLRVATLWLLLWLTPVAALVVMAGSANVFTLIAVFFSKMAMVTFGGAYAVLAYVAQQAVDHYHWLQPREMLDGLGMAETTPGPLIMVLQFVGFMAAFRDPGTLPPVVAGTLGGLLATWVTFTPCFLWIFLGAPFIERLRGNRALAGALSAITAAVVGVILNLAIWFAIHTIFRDVVPVHGYGLSFDAPVLASADPWALALAVGAALAIFRFNLGMLPTLGACASAGIALHIAGLV